MTPILDRECKIDGCARSEFARGWCKAHWTRWRRHGDPTKGGVAAGSLAAFFHHASAYRGSDCLIWPYGKGAGGRGVMWRNGRQHFVHRAVCEEVHGAPPTPQHHAAHLCGNGHLACVNPNHLAWATPAENEAHKVGHGTVSRGEAHGMAVLDEASAGAIRRLRGTMRQADIAKAFGVSKTTVGDIHRRRTWAWLP